MAAQQNTLQSRLRAALSMMKSDETLSDAERRLSTALIRVLNVDCSRAAELSRDFERVQRMLRWEHGFDAQEVEDHSEFIRAQAQTIAAKLFAI